MVYVSEAPPVPEAAAPLLLLLLFQANPHPLILLPAVPVLQVSVQATLLGALHLIIVETVVAHQ